MTNASGKYYEERGDALAAQNRTEEAKRAYRHAMSDYCQPMDLDAYKRVLGKILRIDNPQQQ